jgi:hypothetical protein
VNVVGEGAQSSTFTISTQASGGTSLAVYSAVLSGSTVTISGANLGVKTTPAPTFFQPFVGLANGATPTAAGFDSWINRGGEAVTNADGVGGGSLRCDPGAANNAFPHIGRYLPAGVLELRTAFFFRLYGNVGGAQQVKFVRAGIRVGDPVQDYGGNTAKMYPSIWVYSGPTIGGNSVQAMWRDVNGDGGSYYTEDAGAGSPGIPLGQQVSINCGQWVFADVYYKFNDVGQSNGVFRILLNEAVWQNRTILNPRTTADESFGFVQPIPSIDLANPTDYDYAMSRMYIDTGPQVGACVFLSNSATLSGVTQKFLLSPSAWSASSITAGNAQNIPSGYNYLYVTSPSGETNSAGRVLT